MLRSRRAAVHPTGAHLGARGTARVAAVRTLARGRQRQLRLRAAARRRRFTHTVETSDELARFAAHHLPFYELLHSQRLNVAVWEPMAGS